MLAFQKDGSQILEETLGCEIAWAHLVIIKIYIHLKITEREILKQSWWERIRGEGLISIGTRKVC